MGAGKGKGKTTPPPPPPPPPPPSVADDTDPKQRKKWADPTAGHLSGTRAGGSSATTCPVVAHTPRRYDLPTEEEEMLAHLDEFGYAVVAAAAGPDQIAVSCGRHHFPAFCDSRFIVFLNSQSGCQ